MNTKTEPKPQTANRLKLENVRLSYPNLFKATAMEGGKLKFSAVFLMNKKEHAATIAKIEKIIERATIDKFGKAMKFKPDNVCLHDGNDKAEKEGYGDEVMYLVAKSDTRPAVVDQKVITVAEEDGKIYGGCFVNATIEIYAWTHKSSGNKGVSAQLRAVQFAKDGPSFGGGGPIHAEDEFEPVSDDASDY
jgi:hypothetical protein